MGRPDLVIVSNRGPLSFTTGDDGAPVATRGGGGLVSSLGPAVSGSGATWVAAAITDADRDAATSGVVEAEGFRLRSLVIDPGEYRQFYDVVANATLWFLHHNLFDLARRPHLDRRWRQAWTTFVRVNRAFAEVVADEAPDGATVIVHDYHLPLVGGVLAELRPDLSTIHFHHTPFCEPTALAVLPDDVAAELMTGMAGYRACGFHAGRWARAFEECCRAMHVSAPATFVSPAAVDVEALQEQAAGEECRRELAALDAAVGGRRLIVRVDRIELSKNIVRGFLAFEELLRNEPSWRERVVFGAFVYPSRETLPDYLAYRAEVEALAQRINHIWASATWTPVLLDTSDRYVRSLAALQRYDVLLVNPVRDGLNLVALEGPIVNQRNGVVALSREAGVWDQLRHAALTLNPFDLAGTAEVLAQALAMDDAERAERAEQLRAVSTRRRPSDWLDDQLHAAGA